MSLIKHVSDVQMADSSHAAFAGGHSIFQSAILRSGGSPHRACEIAVKSLQEQGLRNMSPYPLDAHIYFDNLIVEVGMQRLNLVKFLIDKGLTLSFPEYLAHTTRHWHKIDRAGNANQGMFPGDEGENFRHDLEGQELPLPIRYFTVQFNWRELLIAQNSGYRMDDTHIRSGVRKLNELNEQNHLTGSNFKVGGHSLYGILNEPNVNNFNFTGGVSWTNASKTGPDILKDVQAGHQVLLDNYQYGRRILAVPVDYSTKLGEDYYVDSRTLTISERLLKLDYLDEIVTLDFLPADTVVLMVPEDTTVQVLTAGQGPVAIPYGIAGDGNVQIVSKWLVMDASVPWVKSDIEGNSGIAIGTP